ncbi:hypothetical protein M1413_01305, partial [Patescibacteria group bacterium]|nr:hypothetical protein [Patescibacteria group bacterium]
MNTPQQLTARMNRISRLYWVSVLLYVLGVAMPIVIPIFVKLDLGLVTLMSMTALWLVLFSIFLHVSTVRRIDELQAELDKLVS